MCRSEDWRQHESSGCLHSVTFPPFLGTTSLFLPPETLNEPFKSNGLSHIHPSEHLQSDHFSHFAIATDSDDAALGVPFNVYSITTKVDTTAMPDYMVLVRRREVLISLTRVIHFSRDGTISSFLRT